MNKRYNLKYLIKRLFNNPEIIFYRIKFQIEFSIYFLLLTPFLYVNRLLPTQKRIFFAKFRSNRMGHFSPGFHIRYAKKKLNIYKKNCIYCFEDDICNSFLAKQVKKEFLVNRVVFFILILCKNLPYLECLIDYEPQKSQRDIEGLTQRIEMPKFTESENNYCSKWLKKHGWKGPKQKIVCIHLRDSAYLKEFFKNTKFRNIDWEYHSYRDSDIKNFYEGINWLLMKDVFIIRTGKNANTKLEIDSKNILDYPFCNDKKDILDIWFFSKSDLVISSGSGIDEISSAYKVPRIYVNFLPIVDTPSWSKCLSIPKHLYWKKNNLHLTLSDYIMLKRINSTEKFKNKGLLIKSLSSKEIKEIIVDGWNYFVDKEPIKKSDIIQTNNFKEFINNEKYLRKLHQFLNKDWIISSNLFKKKIQI